MSDEPLPRWLAWAREIQALCQTGLAFAQSDYDVKRCRRLMEIAAEMVACHTSESATGLVEGFLSQPGYATPKVDVRGAAMREGKILMVQERCDGRWTMPGGWADVGETPAEMVVREVLEESGFNVVPRKVIGVWDANRGGRNLTLYHAYKVVFLCEIVGGEARPSDETSDVRFFAFSAVPPLSHPRTYQRHLDEVQAHLADPDRPAAFD